MDWAAAISRNRTALLGVVDAIVALIGGREGGPVARHLRNAALALLRPAESAVRRLIVMAAHGLVMRFGTPRPLLQRPAGGAVGAGRTPAFRLVDPASRFAPPRIVRPGGVPRIRTFWGPPAPPVIPSPARDASGVITRPDPDAPVDISRVRLRLRVLEAALADLPRQARRLARLRARWAARPCAPGALPRTPLRLGHPPGHHPRSSRPIDDVLRDCHALALDALSQPIWPRANTS
jgi:hypothetical protein